MIATNVRLNPSSLPQPGNGGSGGATHASIRQINMGLIADALFQAGGGLSRSELATRTGLTKATASRLVSELIEIGIAIEGVPEQASGAGRPRTPIYLANDTMVGLGFDVNVDSVSGVAINLRGEVVTQFAFKVDVVATDPGEILSLLADQIESMRKELASVGIGEVVGASLAVPGIIDYTEQVVLYAPNLNWREVKPVDHLAGVLGEIPLFLDNDANLQAVAVSAHYDAESPLPSTFIYLTGDVGIGSAVVVNGQEMRGTHGWAGEIGHTTVDPDGPSCTCGSQGCLEQYAGKRAIARNASIQLPENPTADPTVLINALEGGDPRALSAVTEAGWALGIALANAVNLLDIGTVVLGTSLAPLLPWLAPELDRQLHKRVIDWEARNLRVLPSPATQLPAAIGGAVVALERGLAEKLSG